MTCSVAHVLSGIRALILAAIVLVLVPAAAAQGVLRGTVADSLDGSTLPGANVLIEGTSIGTATNVDGAYRIAGIPAGEQVVRVSYIGYEPRSIPVTIRDGATTTLDVALLPGGVIGEEVVVTGQAAGQAAAINQQVRSNTIVNVISEEKIQELPDANAAEAIGRLPGVSVQRSGGEANQITLRGLSGAFTSITVDGVKIAPTDAEARSVDLSAISQGSLAGIELFKALTPDKDGDAIAGSVNLVTRRAPATRQLRVDALGSYNELAEDLGQYDLDFRYGERFLDGFLGVQVNGNLEQRNRSKQEYDSDYDCSLNDFTRCQIENLELVYTDEVRQRSGLGAIFDVDTPDGGFVKLSGLYNYTSRDFVTYDRSYPVLDDLVYYSARDREQAVHLFNGALTGENYLFGLSSTWGLSYARSAFDFPFDYELIFTEPSLIEDGEVIAGMDAIPDSVRRGAPEGVIPYALNNFDRAYLYNGFYRTEESTDTDYAAYLNLSREYAVGTSIQGELKVGGKYRSKNRSRNRTELFMPYYIEPLPAHERLSDGTIVERDFSGTMFEDYGRIGNRVLASNFLGGGTRTEDLYGRFTLSPLLDRDAVRTWWDLNRDGYNVSASAPQYRDNPEAAGAFYDIDERVSAGYLMSTVNFGEYVTWIAGLRVEHENNDYESRYAPTGLHGFPVLRGAIRDTSATHQETVWLPNTHLAIRPTDFLTVRLAAYRALARPDFNSRLANVVYRTSSTFFPGNSIVMGNPNLRAAKAWNYEVNASVFGPRIGLFSVSAFYKDITDYFQRINGLSYSSGAVFDSLGIDYELPRALEGGEFSLVVPYNSDRPTTVYGVEVEHQANLRFLPGLLSGLVVGYNFSVVRSSTYVPRVRIETTYIEEPPFPPIPVTERVPYESEQKLQQQPDFFANVSVGWDYRRFSARASVFHQSEYATSFTANTRTGSDNVRGGFTRVDLAFKQGVGENVELLLNLNNLTGVEETSEAFFPHTGRRHINNSEIYGTTVDAGVRVRF